jgi:hypothetical protein
MRRLVCGFAKSGSPLSGSPALRLCGSAALGSPALGVGLTSAVAPSTITGPGAGLSLLAFGIATLLIGSRGSSLGVTGVASG